MEISIPDVNFDIEGADFKNIASELTELGII